MDVHLAWRAQCCRIGDGEAFVGTAPAPSFRAAAALLGSHGLQIAPRLARLVMDYGMVLPLDGLVGSSTPSIAGLHLEGRGVCDGFSPAMLTITLGQELGEHYLRLLPEHTDPSGTMQEVGFMAVVGVDAARSDRLLARVRQAGSIRMSELPNLILGGESATRPA